MTILLILLAIIVYSLLHNKPGQKAILTKRARRHKRSDRNRIIDLNFTSEDRTIIFEKFQNRCFNCGSKKKLTLDHHYPLEKGHGLKNSDGSYNAVLLCGKCNRKKSNKNPENFYTAEQLGILKDKYGVKTEERDIEDFYSLQNENAFVEFNYLGKIYQGTVHNILEEEVKFLGMKNKIYLEIEINGEKHIFPIKGIKSLKKIKES